MTVLSPTARPTISFTVPTRRCAATAATSRMSDGDAGSQAVVAAYLDDHQELVPRCASPMQVEAIDQKSYSLTLGRFGNFGFEVEPTIALRSCRSRKGSTGSKPCRRAASPWPAGSLRRRLPRPGCAGSPKQDTPHRAMGSGSQASGSAAQGDHHAAGSVVQSSGDHLLRQIVRQISRRLTWKVQEDFHATHGLSCPPRRQRAAF